MRIVVIGASAGGVDALKQIVAALPDFPASLFVTLHIPDGSETEDAYSLAALLAD